jgi:hypothetical protein
MNKIKGDKNKEIKKLVQWISDQQKYYKKNQHIMKNENIRKLWEKFNEKNKKYFLSNEENWNNNLKLVEEYIVENNKYPSKENKNMDIKILGCWVSSQKSNYKNNEQIMKDETIRKQWEEFTKKYEKYL